MKGKCKKLLYAIFNRLEQEIYFCVMKDLSSISDLRPSIPCRWFVHHIEPSLICESPRRYNVSCDYVHIDRHWWPNHHNWLPGLFWRMSGESGDIVYCKYTIYIQTL